MNTSGSIEMEMEEVMEILEGDTLVTGFSKHACKLSPNVLDKLFKADLLSLVIVHHPGFFQLLYVWWFSGL